MTLSPEQLAAIDAEFRQSSSTWNDSLCLDFLLVTAHTYGVLPEVDIFRILDEGDCDCFLVSVALCSEVYAHSAPTPWRDVRPQPGATARDALRHVLGQLSEVAAEVRARFLGEVAEIVGAVVADQAR